MTPAWQLHLENVALRAELKQAAKQIRRLKDQSRCTYCGHPCAKGARACAGHSDLLAVDAGAAA